MKVGEIIKDCAEWMPGGNYDTEMPCVSVLLPTFRRAKSGLFEIAVDSVLNQEMKDLELIIIDDASTDGTADLIKKYMEQDSRVGCIRHKWNVGLPAISEYEGFMKARGEYIAFIFDDNKWEKDYLRRTIDYMQKYGAKAAFGRMRSYYSTEEKADYVELGCSSIETGIGLNSLSERNFIPNGAVIIAKEVFCNPDVGLYDPHVAMTRICDWDLWKRVNRSYEFYETGIFAGAELGCSQKDSLGNTYKMSAWATAERETQVKPKDLLPENYLQIQINNIASRSTNFYKDAVEDFYNNFKEKKWWREENLKLKVDKAPLRIMVLAVVFDATIELVFGRLAAHCGFVLMMGKMDMPIYEMAQADVVILVRNLVGLDKYKQAARMLHIPCYYYIDDNFLLLEKLNKGDYFLGQMRKLLVPEYMKDFEGIIASTEELRKEFLNRNLHDQVYVLEPCIDEKNIYPVSEEKKDKEITIAYMGGAFRDQVFCEVVMPAIKKLAEEMQVCLLCPDRINITQYENIKNLQIRKIEYTLSLDLALKRYKKYNPDILLHCGPDIENNKFKTENALINAVQLGAVLVASDMITYKEAYEMGYCLCISNITEEWYKGLKCLMEDQKEQKNIYTHAKTYCAERYGYNSWIRAMQRILDKKQPTKYYEIIRRLNAAMYDALFVGTLNAGRVMEGKTCRSLREVPLSFTGEIERYRKYRVRCDVNTFSELGICFASFGETGGEVRIGIWNGQEKLREVVFALEEFVHDFWTYIEFEPIENAKNKRYIITLEFKYAQGAAKVGVFEDATKRSFIYKVMNRLGHPLLITDLLFADCR